MPGGRATPGGKAMPGGRAPGPGSLKPGNGPVPVKGSKPGKGAPGGREPGKGPGIEVGIETGAGNDFGGNGVVLTTTWVGGCSVTGCSGVCLSMGLSLDPPLRISAVNSLRSIGGVGEGARREVASDDPMTVMVLGVLDCGVPNLDMGGIVMHTLFSCILLRFS